MTPQNDQDDCEEPRMPHSIPRGFLRFLIISLLRSDELTGTEIMDVLEQRSEGRWKPSPGSIYPLLESLKDDGLIEIVSEKGRSKTYRISESGREHFKMTTHRKGVLDHKTRLSRVLWLQLLAPSDQVHFHLSGIRHATDFIDEAVDSLSKKDRKKVATRLGKIIDRLEQLKTKTQNGE
ncbi:MAG: PadR family transcriptional regulator [Candidatus Thorarchaeota archaeon]